MEIISGNIIDVVSRRIFKGKISVEKGVVLCVNECDVAEESYVLPGLVNSHVHIESSMLVPSEFAKVIVGNGVVGVVSDPHEIANVLGVEGVEFMINNSNSVPVKFFFGAPSCVPATLFEGSGCAVDKDDVCELLKKEEVFFLSEVMNFPGVINEDTDICEKIAFAIKQGKVVDGHAPALTGEALQKYIDSGISTDHECSFEYEAEEKIMKGMNILIREGSAAKNFDMLHNLITKFPDKVMLCTDDSHPHDLLNGDVVNLVKKALSYGHELFDVLRSATYNPIKHYGLNVGLLQVGDPADFIIIDSLSSFNVEKTYINGDVVFDNGKVLFDSNIAGSINNFNCSKITIHDILVKSNGSGVKVIKAIDGELITEQFVWSPKVEKDFILPDISMDILKIVVVNRYGNNSTPVVGFVNGFGLKSGAIAGSIAHDSHNIIAVGTNDSDIVSAVNNIIDNKGGIVAQTKDEFLDLKLSIAGIMSNQDAAFVADRYVAIDQMAKHFGSSLKAPFMTLSFMALLVIPELKIGDKGLFDTNNFKLTSLFVD